MDCLVVAGTVYLRHVEPDLMRLDVVLLTSELADKVVVLGTAVPEDHTLNRMCDNGDHRTRTTWAPKPWPPL